MQKCEKPISEPICAPAVSVKKTNLYVSLAIINQGKLEEDESNQFDLNSPKVKYLVRYKP